MPPPYESSSCTPCSLNMQSSQPLRTSFLCRTNIQVASFGETRVQHGEAFLALKISQSNGARLADQQDHLWEQRCSWQAKHATRRNSSSHAPFSHPNFSKPSRLMPTVWGKPNPAPANPPDRHADLRLQLLSINHVSAFPPHVAPFSSLLREPHSRIGRSAVEPLHLPSQTTNYTMPPAALHPHRPTKLPLTSAFGSPWRRKRWGQRAFLAAAMVSQLQALLLSVGGPRASCRGFKLPPWSSRRNRAFVIAPSERRMTIFRSTASSGSLEAFRTLSQVG